VRIRINKRSDGGGVLRCDRADGSSTWQKQTRHAAFFAHHDLTHYAVETALGYQRGFFGLVAEGWDIEDTTGKGARGPLPEEAIEVERLVGTLDTERAGGVRWTIEEFNAYAPRPLTQDALDRIRARRAELFRMWSAVAPGDSLELEWPS
jgi:hypothetical protein